MSARVLVIGLDAAEASLLERWTNEGFLPTFGRLARNATPVSLANSLETLPGAIWPEIVTGISGGRLARFYHSRKLHTGEAGFRRIDEAEVDRSQSYWAVAGAHGLRVAALDQPQSLCMPGQGGVQLMEWGVHDRSFGTATEPPELLEEILHRYGTHPVEDCDHGHDGTEAGYLRLLDDLLHGIATREKMYLDVLQRDDWDLFACGFSETHCTGHQFWHFLDPKDRAHDPNAHPRLQTAIREAYQRVDAAIGKLIDAAGADANTNTLVFASHGMGLYIGGYQLLPEIINRLGYSSGAGGAAVAVRSKLPIPVRTFLRRIVPASARQRLQAAAGSLPEPLASPATRAITVPNNRCGAVRLNLAGREPNGSVQPGPEADAILEDLRRELLALENPRTGARIVKRVMTAEEAFGPDRNPDVPDLIVAFRDDLGPLEECRGPRVGHIRVRLGGDPNLPRSGDHTVQSRLWVSGPAFEVRPIGGSGNVLDIAPTVLQLLNVPLPADLDGKPLIEPVVTA